nr:MAG TPA: Protein of unknown function (DUF551) [Caudoviricetes sp.]
MTRKEIIKALRQFIHQFDGRDVGDYFVEDVLEAAANLLDQDAKKTSWISVKDRPPEPNERVLAYFPGTRDSEAVILPSKGWAVNKFVSHWMSMPEPPKEEAK